MNIEKQIVQKYVYNTTEWKKLRQKKLFKNPLCEECLKQDIIKPATQIHHITPLKTGQNIEQIIHLGLDFTNLMSLCTDCHNAKHHNKKH